LKQELYGGVGLLMSSPARNSVLAGYSVVVTA
jgi:hypothetical protein